MKLEQLSKFALALNSPGSPTRQTPHRPRQRSQFTDMVEKLSPTHEESVALDDKRDYSGALSQIRCVDELHIDYRRALSLKRGDLAIIQGEVFRCTPVAPHLSEIPLILKRYDCVDRRTYDLKVYEADSLARFQGHPNIVSLYSYWSEKPASPYTYKTLVLMEEEGIRGDLHATVVQNPTRPFSRLCLKYLCDITKGLLAVHNCGIIHARIKPTSIYIDASNTAMIGEFGKTELDSARQTHQLFSKILIGEAIPRTLVYWAPELLTLRKYGKQADMWALGVTLYEMVTGQHPFNTQDEHTFREQSLSGRVDNAPLEKYPRIATIIENLIRVNPEERWTAQEVLTYAQFEFAVDIQRTWRGYMVRKEFKRVRAAVTLIQSHIRGWLTYINYWRNRAVRRHQAGVKIQAQWRTYKCRDLYVHQRSAIMRCQANVLARQTRRAYLKYRDDVILAQSLVRRFLCLSWYAKVLLYKKDLETKLLTVQTMIQKYQSAVSEFTTLFPGSKLPPSLQHLASFEDFELSQPPAEYGSVVCLPKLRSANEHIEALDSSIRSLREQLRDYEEEKAARETEDEELKRQLGSKYCELHPMINALKKNLARVEQQCKRAIFLPIAIQHPYTYSKWDSVHEPENRVENSIHDDDAVYRALSPNVDLTLCNGQACFISEVIVYPGECGPAMVEIYVSNVPEKFSLVSSFKCSRDAEQVFQLPGEQLARYLRIRFPNNLRGGNIVAIKRVKVKGLVSE